MRSNGRWHEKDEPLPYSRGMRISLSFSCPEEMYGAISDVQLEERVKLSQAVQHLIRYGLIYKRILQEQALEKKGKKVSAKPKKQPKPKTRSKKT